MKDTNHYELTKEQRREAYAILVGIPSAQLTIAYPIKKQDHALRNPNTPNMNGIGHPEDWLALFPTFDAKAKEEDRSKVDEYLLFPRSPWHKRVPNDQKRAVITKGEVITRARQRYGVDDCFMGRRNNCFDKEAPFMCSDKALVLYRILRSIGYTHRDACDQLALDLPSRGVTITAYDC